MKVWCSLLLSLLACTAVVWCDDDGELSCSGVVWCGVMMMVSCPALVWCSVMMMVSNNHCGEDWGR